MLPVAYAVKGGRHARNLWQYKSDACDEVAAGAALSLLALILVFLRDHGTCAWHSVGEPTHVTVVPSARGRPGEHPLRALIAPYLTWSWANLSARPDQRERDLDPERFSAEPVPGGRVLLIDDTWTTGASAQSAAMALRRAGARTVATVVIGRHIGPDQAALLDFGPASMPFATNVCAVHHTEPVANSP